MNKQRTAPLFDGLLHYLARSMTAFHTPGHRGGRGLDELFAGANLLALDLTELPDLDGASVEQRRAEAEGLAAEFFGAETSHFLVNGATEGILALLLSLGKPGDTVIVAGDCHLSVIHGLILADLNPVFLPPQWVPGWSLPMLPDAQTLRRAVAEHPGVCGVWLTHPSYAGVIGNIQALAQVVHDYNLPLLLDEAHGGYLQLAGIKTPEARDVADAWVQGAHKIMGSLTQTGLLHLKGKRLDHDRVARSLAWVRSTSPSYLLLASLDTLRRRLASRGEADFGRAVEKSNTLRRQLAAAGVCMLQAGSGESFQIDPLKLVVSFLDSGWTGPAAWRVLAEEFRVQPEFFDRDRVGFFFSGAQQEQDWSLLARALAEINARKYSAIPSLGPPPLERRETVLRPREAAFANSRDLPLLQAGDCIAASAVAPYPPGIPLWVPGERILAEAVRWLADFLAAGGHVTGLAPGGLVPVVA